MLFTLFFASAYSTAFFALSAQPDIPVQAAHSFAKACKRGSVKSQSVSYRDDDFELCTTDSDHGGAIYAEITTTFTVRDCEFESCSVTGISYSGGAIYVIPSADEATLKVVVRDNDFDKCSCTGFGGAMYAASKEQFSLRDNDFSRCSAEKGGLVYAIISTGENSIRDNDFKEGRALLAGSTNAMECGSGGALFLTLGHLDAKISIRDTKFKRCTADQNGGAVFITRIANDESTAVQTLVSFQDCLFKNNSAHGEGEVANDVFFTQPSTQGLSKSSFRDSASTSEQPRIVAEGTGDLSTFLPNYNPQPAIVFGAVFGSMFLLIVVVLLFCCCCSCCPIAKCFKRSREAHKATETQTLLVNTGTGDKLSKADDPGVKHAAYEEPHANVAPNAPQQLPPYQVPTKDQNTSQPPQQSSYPVYSPAFAPPPPSASHPRDLAM